MLGLGKRKKYVYGRMDDTCDYTVDAAARMAGDPIFVRGKADGTDFNAMGLYIIGNEELWLNVNAVLIQRQKLELESDGEKRRKHLLNIVAYMPIETRYVDNKTNQEYFVYKLKNGEQVKFTPEEIINERLASMEKKDNKVRIREYNELEDVAMQNECLVLNGNKDDEFAIGTWVTSKGKLVKYTIGTVKAKRIELGLEESEADGEFSN